MIYGFEMNEWMNEYMIDMTVMMAGVVVGKTEDIEAHASRGGDDKKYDTRPHRPPPPPFRKGQ